MLLSQRRGWEPFASHAMKNSHPMTVHGHFEPASWSTYNFDYTVVFTDTKESMYRTVIVFCMPITTLQKLWELHTSSMMAFPQPCNHDGASGTSSPQKGRICEEGYRTCLSFQTPLYPCQVPALSTTLPLHLSLMVFIASCSFIIIFILAGLYLGADLNGLPRHTWPCIGALWLSVLHCTLHWHGCATDRLASKVKAIEIQNLIAWCISVYPSR